MGFLKGRFCCLRGLRVQINQERDHTIATFWITACVILHNLIIDIEREIDDSDEFYIEILRQGMEGVVEDGVRDEIAVDLLETPGQQKRTELKQQLLAELALRGAEVEE